MAKTEDSKNNFVSKSCQGEICRMCGAPAVKKVGEEFMHDSPEDFTHNLTAYVCLDCFKKIFMPYST